MTVYRETSPGSGIFAGKRHIGWVESFGDTWTARTPDGKVVTDEATYRSMARLALIEADAAPITDVAPYDLKLTDDLAPGDILDRGVFQEFLPNTVVVRSTVPLRVLLTNGRQYVESQGAEVKVWRSAEVRDAFMVTDDSQYDPTEPVRRTIADYDKVVRDNTTEDYDALAAVAYNTDGGVEAEVNAFSEDIRMRPVGDDDSDDPDEWTVAANKFDRALAVAVRTYQANLRKVIPAPAGAITGQQQPEPTVQPTVEPEALPERQDDTDRGNAQTLTVGQIRAALATYPDDTPVLAYEGKDVAWYRNIELITKEPEDIALIIGVVDDYDPRQW